MAEEKQFLIESIFILESESGICIFEENYSDYIRESISVDLISSFLSAILAFANETFAEDIQHIQLMNHKIMFEFTEHVLFVLLISNDDKNVDSDFKSIIGEIAASFIKKYADRFVNDNWGANVSQFDGFSEDLRDIIKGEPLAIKMLQKVDWKESFKKFEDNFKRMIEKFQQRRERFEKLVVGVVKKSKDKKRIKKLLQEKKKLEKKLNKES